MEPRYYLVVIELLDVDGNVDRIDGMTVIGDLERAQNFREMTHKYYDDRGFAVCIKIYSDQDILKAFRRI